jgi:hypothetical protein
MSGCLMAGALTVALSASGQFSLEWTHSVEKEGWREVWAVEEGRMRLVEAAVKGSGAGMEPGPEGRFVDGWWVWAPHSPPVPELILAASGETPSGWLLCGAECVTLGVEPGAPIHLRPCEE